MNITITISEKYIFAIIDIYLNLESIYYKIKISNEEFSYDKFQPDFINSFEQSNTSNINNIFFKKKFFNQFIKNNNANYNKYIYKIKNQINELQTDICDMYVLIHGL